MADKLRDALVAKAEELGWSVTSDGETEWEFWKNSPAGEDFSFCINADNSEAVIREVADYARNFDTEEHIKMWIRAGDNGVSGVPSIKELVKDADDIQEMIQELADGLCDAEQEVPEE